MFKVWVHDVYKVGKVTERVSCIALCSRRHVFWLSIVYKA